MARKAFVRRSFLQALWAGATGLLFGSRALGTETPAGATPRDPVGDFPTATTGPKVTISVYDGMGRLISRREIPGAGCGTMETEYIP